MKGMLLWLFGIPASVVVLLYLADVLAAASVSAF